MEKLSRTLAGLMLALAALLLILGLAAGTLLDLRHPSYLAALLGALLLLVPAWLLRRKRNALAARLQRLSPARWALGLVLLCLAVNGLWLLLVRLEPEGDYVVFWQTAQLLSRGERPEGSAHLYLCLFPHLLGYSGFLAPFLRLFGESTAVPVLWNLAFTGISCLLLFRLCLDWLGLPAAVTAGLLWCFLPSKMLYNAMVLSEPLYTCLLLLFLLLVQWASQQQKLWRVLLSGALSGLLLQMLNLVRPIAAVPIIAAGIWILLLRGGQVRDKRAGLRWGGWFVLLLAVYLSLGRAGQSFLTGFLGEEPARVPGYNIYVGFNPDTQGSYSEEDMAAFGEVLHGPGEEDVNKTQRLMLDLALERAGSVKLPRLLLGKLQTFLGRDEGAVYYSARALSEPVRKLCTVFSNVWFYLLLLLSLPGLLRLRRRREQGAILLAPLYCIGLTLAQMLAEVANRYHYSILPMLVILAACAVGEKEETP
ncbi:MAG: hypothetical protein IKH34_04205 [Oscillospiraceae bacterium]|nr:hypothetical protein [Oscillospiraceae bacterium]